MSDAGVTPEPEEAATQAIVAIVLAGLRRPLTPDEEQRLDALIAAVPNGRSIADDVVERWLMVGLLDRTVLCDDASDDAHKPVADIATRPLVAGILPRRHLLRYAGVAAVVGTATLAGYRGWQAIRPASAGDERIIVTNGNGPSHTRLADGSSIMVSRYAQIASMMSGDERRIRHISGEVFYQVAADPRRPFVVEAGGYRLTALGTGFNVDPLDDGVCVDLLDGRLRIERIDEGRALVLTAGQRFLGGAEGRVVSADPDVAAWGDGRLVFDDVPLADVARRLRNHSDVALIPADAAVARLRFSGVMETGSPRAWRLGLEAALPVRAVQRQDGLFIEMARDRADV